MLVIFLDIDGVLNTESFVGCAFQVQEILNKNKITNISLNDIIRDQYGLLFDPLSVKSLEIIIKNTGAKLVISSTWRHSGIEIMQEMWKIRNLPGEVVDITPTLRNTEDKRPFKERCDRGHEIKKWLDTHPEVTGYLILDDDDDMLPEQQPNFLQTHFQYGLMTKQIQLATEILNKPL
jgi:hypothetical protein